MPPPVPGPLGNGTLAIPRHDPHAVSTSAIVNRASDRRVARVTVRFTVVTVVTVVLSARTLIPPLPPQPAAPPAQDRPVPGQAPAPSPPPDHRESPRAPGPAAVPAADTTAAAADCARRTRSAARAGCGPGWCRTPAARAGSPGRARPAAPRANPG